MTQALVELRSAVRPFLAKLEAGDRIVVAVSGGADSLALAGALIAESSELLITCIGVTIDHQLQSGSAEQATLVVKQLQQIGYAEIISERINVDQSNGPESGARDARYKVLHRIASEKNAKQIYLGHTKDDQAETVLLGLARGSGARSLSAMAAVNGILIRPFLAISRTLTEKACRDLGLDFWSDPHNLNIEFSRVRIRTRVLPVMEDELGPGITDALVRSASLLRDDADALDAMTEEASRGRNLADLEIQFLESLPKAIRTRLIRMAIYAQGAPAGSVTAEHVAAVEALVTSWRGQGEVSLPGGVKVARISGRLSAYARS